MMHYAVFDKTTGQLVSTGTEVSTDLPNNLDFVEGWDGPESSAPANIPGLQWMSSERRFIHNTLTTSVNHISANGTDVATITFQTDDTVPPDTIVFNVNGTEQTVSVVNKSASIDVNSNTPGDTITVQVDVDESLIVTVAVN